MPGDPTAKAPFGTAREPPSRARWTRPPSPALLVGCTEASPGYRRPNDREKQRNARVKPTRDNVAEDLLSGDFGPGKKQGPKDIELLELLEATDVVLAEHMNVLFGTISSGSMAKVARELVGRFQTSGGPYGSGGGTEHYQSKTLNEEIGKTSTFGDYDARFQRQFDARLSLSKLDPTSLANRPIEMEDLDFSSLWEQATGLGIAIHQVHAVEVRISKYTFNEGLGTWDCLFHYALYDHFGLDREDIRTICQSLKGRVDRFWNGFLSWYVLQHYRGYKPFIVEANITRRKRPVEAKRPTHRGR